MKIDRLGIEFVRLATFGRLRRRPRSRAIVAAPHADHCPIPSWHIPVERAIWFQVFGEVDDFVGSNHSPRPRLRVVYSGRQIGFHIPVDVIRLALVERLLVNVRNHRSCAWKSINREILVKRIVQ